MKPTPKEIKEFSINLIKEMNELYEKAIKKPKDSTYISDYLSKYVDKLSKAREFEIPNDVEDDDRYEYFKHLVQSKMCDYVMFEEARQLANYIHESKYKLEPTYVEQDDWINNLDEMREFVFATLVIDAIHSYRKVSKSLFRKGFKGINDEKSVMLDKLSGAMRYWVFCVNMKNTSPENAAKVVLAESLDVAKLLIRARAIIIVSLMGKQEDIDTKRIDLYSGIENREDIKQLINLGAIDIGTGETIKSTVDSLNLAFEELKNMKV